MKKRLVVCCDGTWNYADQVHDGKPCPTNVTRLHRHLAPIGLDGVPQWGYYHHGVGVQRWERLVGGAAGYGLSRHVRTVYTWLAQNYRCGDEIFLFGFSRGAYTARSTVGLIRTCGIVQREADRIDPQRVHEAYGLYRRAGGETDGQAAKRFRAEHSVAERIPIKFIGVWDTVGALGIPLNGPRFFNLVNRRYAFHNVNLSSWVENAHQALAIDEQRTPFTPAIWRQSEDAKKSQQTLEQVWFAGVHSDIGGGYPDGELADLSLRWMLDRAARHGLGVDELQLAPVDDLTVMNGRVHDSSGGIYRFIQRTPRAIGTSDESHEWLSSSAERRFTDSAGYKPDNLVQYLLRGQHRTAHFDSESRRDPMPPDGAAVTH